MTESILVTGATGTIGQHVVSALSDRDVAVRIGVRDPETVSNEIADTGEVIEFDFTRPETWGRALTDVDGIFLVRPPVVDKSDIGSFVEAADRVGVARIAYLSTLGAEKNVLVPHHWIENRITATDMEYTLLRASFFMQNLLEVHRADIVEHGEIFVPAGDGKTSFVDARDIGEAAAIVLTESGHANRAYDLTGPEALDYEEVATIFSDVLNRSIRYPNPSLLAFGRRMRRRGKPFGFIALMCGIYTTARLGLAARVTDDSRKLLGRRPRGMRAFVEDHADDFRGDSQPNESLTGNDVESGYVETRGPPVPDIAYKIINPVMSRLLRSPLHPLVSDSIMLLTFTGSKTGREYTTPVGYWVKNGHLIVTTQSPWWRNLKGGQPVSMQVQGQHREGIATPHPDPEDATQYIKEFIDRHGTDATRRLGIRIRGDREPTLDELEAGVEGTVVIDIELTDDKPPVR
nr:nitroreductase/quinone reductase family protein [Halorussus halobius]